MGKVLLSIIAAAAVIAFVDSSCLQCSYEFDVDFGGDYIHMEVVPGYKICAELCTANNTYGAKNETCHAFTFTPDSNKCYLKSEVHEKNFVYKMAQRVSGRCHRCVIQMDWDYPGAEMDYHECAGSVYHCGLTCEQQTHCRGFTFDLLNGTCWTKRDLTSGSSQFTVSDVDRKLVGGTCFSDL